MIRKSKKRDLGALMELFAEARSTIAELGIDQWQNGYPNEAVILSDISKGQSYAVEEDGGIAASFAVISDGEPAYDRIYNGSWRSEADSYLAIHRVAIAVAMRGKGIASQIMSFAEAMAREQGRISLRIDTHHGNVVMRRMLEKQGFVPCGDIYLADGGLRIAYERVL